MGSKYGPNSKIMKNTKRTFLQTTAEVWSGKIPNGEGGNEVFHGLQSRTLKGKFRIPFSAFFVAKFYVEHTWGPLTKTCPKKLRSFCARFCDGAMSKSCGLSSMNLVLGMGFLTLLINWMSLRTTWVYVLHHQWLSNWTLKILRYYLVSTVPLRNSGCSSTFNRNGMLVFTPRIRNSLRLRLSLAAVACKVSGPSHHHWSSVYISPINDSLLYVILLSSIHIWLIGQQ